MARRSTLLRTITVGLLGGALLVGSAWAAVGLVPRATPEATHELPSADEVLDAAQLTDATGPSAVRAGREQLDPEDIPAAAAGAVRLPSGRTPDGTFLVGAARASLAPAPEVFGGPDDTWRKEGCTSLDEGHLDQDHVVPDPADPKGWPGATPGCIYLGGFGIGPARPATAVGHGGVWVRTIAVSNGEKTFIYAIADTVGWFARYDASVCADCGIRDVRERLAGDLGVDLGDIIVGSTHTHAGADTYGGWGGIPHWYRSQIRDAAIASAKQAVANLEPATISVGETHLRQRNNERRDTYHSTADTGASWVQATTLPGRGSPGGEVVATWSTFAGHPTIVSDAILHADWPGAATRRFEALYGGVGVVFEGGLGNVSISGASNHPDVPSELQCVDPDLSDDEDPCADQCNSDRNDECSAERTGYTFADEVASAIDSHATPLRSSDLAADVRDITHPAGTNPGLTTLATIGLFDREFTPGTPGAGLPGTYGWSKAGQWGTTELAPPPFDPENPEDFPGNLRSCVTAGPTIITTTGAHRIGELVVAFAPGEIFSNIAEVVKEKADWSVVTMVMGQTNDALGYIIQSFEFDLQGNALTEYGTQTGEYEEVFAIDRCFGDHVLETILSAASQLRP